jgi:hypothetical protein
MDLKTIVEVELTVASSTQIIIISRSPLMHTAAKGATYLSRTCRGQSYFPFSQLGPSAAGAGLGLVSTAAAAGGSRRRMAEASLSCSYDQIQDGVNR